MNLETRQCQNCHQNFVIEPDDFDFYEKIKVSAPTWCWECRARRRMTWRNERTLHRRKCALTGRDVISCFSQESNIVVYDRDVWWSDKWDPLSFGQAYDFNKPFFLQFKDLLGKTPMPSLFNSRCTNSEYGNHNGELKNAYLIFATWGGEDIMYGSQAHGCKNSLEILSSGDSELCYEIINSKKLYKSAFIENSENCNDSYFLYECRGCSNCFGCTNLRNKSYWMFNQFYSKEEYFKKLKELDFSDHRQLSLLKTRFKEIKLHSIRRFANIYNSQNATGDNLFHVSNCKYCFDFLNDVRDCKFCTNGGIKMYEGYDGYGIGANGELIYESVDTGADGSRFYFDIFVWTGNSVQYSYASHGCTNCFACIGLRSKQYCILNKQYTKEEYESLVPKIIQHMNDMPYTDSKGRIYRYGEFFPPDLSPFAYNETIAQEYFPLTKDQAEAQGYRWKDPDTKEYTITVKPESLPDYIKDVDDSITKETVGCAHQGTCIHQCTTAFRIIPEELSFYRRMNLSLPRLCPNCRHYERLAQRNPLKLWHRGCMCDKPNHVHKDHCPNEFETSYAPERKEIVYCESCYNSEVV